jgi:hypothetical protein
VAPGVGVTPRVSRLAGAPQQQAARTPGAGEDSSPQHAGRAFPSWDRAEQAWARRSAQGHVVGRLAPRTRTRTLAEGEPERPVTSSPPCASCHPHSALHRAPPSCRSRNRADPRTGSHLMRPKTRPGPEPRDPGGGEPAPSVVRHAAFTVTTQIRRPLRSSPVDPTDGSRLRRPRGRAARWLRPRAGRGRAARSQSSTVRSRRALPITVTELRLIAAAAIIGDSSQPSQG